MTKLLTTDDLMFGHKSVLWRLLAKVALWLFGARKANKAYANVVDKTDMSLAAITAELQITPKFDPKSLENIPAQGPTIIICNHPTGIVDGIILLDIVTRVRQDVKFLGNFLLERVEPMKPYLIPVNPFEERKGGNIYGLKEGLRHLHEGGCLLLFPAGEVSTWQKGWHHIADKKWDTAAIKLMRKSKATIVPAWIDGRNSLTFRVLGKIHPRLRTAMLLHEIFNKRGKTFPTTIGAPIPPVRLRELEDLDDFAHYTRAMVDYLKDCREKPVRSLAEIEASQGSTDDIIAPVSLDLLKLDIEGLGAEGKLFDYGDTYSIYLARYEQIPNVMREIGRLRELTFRAIGEGSQKACDTDEYDTYYRQLFIWDNEAQTIVGGYRMGFGGEIVKDRGIDGFYTHSLFAYDKEMAPMLSRTIELGRSFVCKAYQRKPASLLMLWRGILYALLKNEEYDYLIGPVTISGEFQRSSKTLIMTHLQQHHFDHELAAHIRPRTGAEGIDFPLDGRLIEKIESIELIDKIVKDIEMGERAIPILFKKYLQLGSYVLGFNVDHDFCDALDALMLLDLSRVPDSKVQMLAREVEPELVAKRFPHYNAGE
ncbi:MAG: lysophospholipid acyltransferase family protein [Rikenellaceae bacterium]|nr:lysophospholipid acyltransferase family protein [Rikenellaceae bacterium]